TRDLDTRHWVWALRSSPVRVLFPSGQVEEQKHAPDKKPHKAVPQAGFEEQRHKHHLEISPSQTPHTWEEAGLYCDKAFPGDRRLSSVMTIVNRLEYIKELWVDQLKGASLIKVKFEYIKDWSYLVTPQGIMGIFAKPDPVKVTYPKTQLYHSLPLVLICDNLHDSGDLGMILRSAAGTGCSKVLLTKGCVDAWKPKVLRS
ncbi:rRNA methyltransferase 3, mitochondrial, partial [Sigmodon hispidus]